MASPSRRRSRLWEPTTATVAPLSRPGQGKSGWSPLVDCQEPGRVGAEGDIVGWSDDVRQRGRVGASEPGRIDVIEDSARVGRGAYGPVPGAGFGHGSSSRHVGREGKATAAALLGTGACAEHAAVEQVCGYSGFRGRLRSMIDASAKARGAESEPLSVSR
jgi:hypothetical protein